MAIRFGNFGEREYIPKGEANMRKVNERINIVNVNVWIGFLIFLSMAIISFSHTAALFERTAYEGVFAILGTIGCETAFILGAGNVVWSKSKGVRAGKASWFISIVGILIILYSNISSGIAHDGNPIVFFQLTKTVWITETTLIGALIPIVIVAAKMVVSHAAVIWLNQKDQETNTHQTADTVVEEYHIKRTRAKQEVKQEKQKIEQKTFKDNEQSNSKIKQTTKVKHNEGGTFLVHQTFEESQSSNNQETVKDQKASNNRINHLLNADENKRVSELAIKIKDQTGKYPSIRVLAGQAGCTNHRAKTVLDILKQTNGETS